VARGYAGRLIATTEIRRELSRMTSRKRTGRRAYSWVAYGAAHSPSRNLRLFAAAAAVAAFVAGVVLAPLSAHGAPAGPTVSTAKTALGRILVDARGRTLYLFEKDRGGKSACSGKCATFWPPLIASGKPHAVGDAKQSLIGTTRRPDGRIQLTYNHHPLYLFVKDAKRGQTNGEGVSAFGAKWYAVSPRGSKVEKVASSRSGY
jgi:predicted lipoprotein with Yx(FWY)xxD motif